MTDRNLVELSADFICAVIALGDPAFRKQDAKWQQEKREREAKEAKREARAKSWGHVA